MNRLFFATVCVLLSIIGSLADQEHEEHGHNHQYRHHDHDGHDHHDHESHRKLFTGDDDDDSEEPSEDQYEKLRTLTNKIDTDHDGKVSRDEMHAYTVQRINEQHAREADEFVSALGLTKNDKIKFDAFVRENFGDTDINELLKTGKTDTQSRETRRTYIADKQKWTHLDKDGDQELTYDEFRKFLRPENDDELREIEIETIMKEYDDDNDGRISNAEYLKMSEAETGDAETLSDELDTNKDGYGSREEFIQYYLPTLAKSTDEETTHLIGECDADNDGYCTPDEIVDAYSSFAGSQITDYGADLEESRIEL